MPPKLGRKVQRLTKTQKNILMERFQANEYPTTQEKCELAVSLNVEEKTIINRYTTMRHQKAMKAMSSEGEYCSVMPVHT